MGGLNAGTGSGDCIGDCTEATSAAITGACNCVWFGS